MRIRLALATTILLFTFTGMVALAEQRPAWVDQGSGSRSGPNGKMIVAVGAAHGHFAMERSAYFAALHDLSRMLETYDTVLHHTYVKENVEEPKEGNSTDVNEEGSLVRETVVMDTVSHLNLLPGTTCSSLTTLTETANDVPQTAEKAASYEEFIESSGGPLVVWRFLEERIAGQTKQTVQTATLVEKCIVDDMATLLILLPIADRYVERKPDGTMDTYVLVQMPLKLSDEKIRELTQRDRELLKDGLNGIEGNAEKAHRVLEEMIKKRKNREEFLKALEQMKEN